VSRSTVFSSHSLAQEGSPFTWWYGGCWYLSEWVGARLFGSAKTYLVVRAHDAARLALGDAVLEAREVRVNEVLLGHEHVDLLAVGVVPVLQLVRDEVLAARGRLEGVRHLARVLEALDTVTRGVWGGVWGGCKRTCGRSVGRARKPNLQIDRVLAAQERVLASGLNVPPPPARFGIVRS
jgi:hypothetical protein